MRYTVHPKKLPRTLPQATNKSKASKEHRHQKDTTPAKVVKCFFGDRTKEEAKSRSVSVGRKKKRHHQQKPERMPEIFRTSKKRPVCIIHLPFTNGDRMESTFIGIVGVKKERKKGWLVLLLASSVSHTLRYIHTHAYWVST